MRYLIPTMAVLLGACSSVVSPRLDEYTGTTLAQRCVDYRASMVAMEAAGETGSTAYMLAQTWVMANCPVVAPEPLPAPEPVPAPEPLPAPEPAA